MNAIDRLTELFREFPGIGPRQAKRFVYHLLGQQPARLHELARLITQIKDEVQTCTSCLRLFNTSAKSPLCNICKDSGRDQGLLMIVEKDIDLESIEKSHGYHGMYFVLGGTVAILEKEPELSIRSRELVSKIEKEIQEKKLTEIILAFSVNAEGENTADYIENLLKPITEANNIKISTLGRGLSTGSEVEYADTETLKNALKNRI